MIGFIISLLCSLFVALLLVRSFREPPRYLVFYNGSLMREGTDNDYVWHPNHYPLKLALDIKPKTNCRLSVVKTKTGYRDDYLYNDEGDWELIPDNDA